MCDAMVALGDVTKKSSVIFAKNSDRPAGECQVLHFSPSRKPRPDGKVRCSYVQVPESEVALATIGCRPYWCWGYETGVNEAGVVGGNTAIFTRSLQLNEDIQPPGLTGMDLLRFGLERGDTAEKAVEVVVGLLEKYGQWGSAVQGQDHDEGYYENAFLLTDRKEAWVLETTGRRWISRRIDSGYWALSNQPTIRDEWTSISPDIKDLAQDMEWWKPEREEFDFARVYGDHEHYSRQVSHIRWKRTSGLLEKNKGAIDVSSMMQILRDHYEDTFLDGPQFHQFLPDFHTVCMHDSLGKFTWGNTATSLIVELEQDGTAPARIFLAYLPPCTSIYIGFAWFDMLPEMLTRPGKAGLDVCEPKSAPQDTFDASSLWWRFHRIVEAVREDPKSRYPETFELFRPIEQRNIEKVSVLHNTDAKQADWARLIEEQLLQAITAMDTLEIKWGIT